MEACHFEPANFCANGKLHDTTMDWALARNAMQIRVTPICFPSSKGKDRDVDPLGTWTSRNGNLGAPAMGVRLVLAGATLPPVIFRSLQSSKYPRLSSSCSLAFSFARASLLNTEKMFKFLTKGLRTGSSSHRGIAAGWTLIWLECGELQVWRFLPWGGGRWCHCGSDRIHWRRIELFIIACWWKYTEKMLQNCSEMDRTYGECELEWMWGINLCPEGQVSIENNEELHGKCACEGRRCERIRWCKNLRWNEAAFQSTNLPIKSCIIWTTLFASEQAEHIHRICTGRAAKTKNNVARLKSPLVPNRLHTLNQAGQGPSIFLFRVHS